MEQKIITSSSASGLNQKIAEMQKEGWEPIGSHSVVTTHEQKIFSGLEHKRTEFEREYSQTIKREKVPTREEKKGGSSIVLEHMLGYLSEEQVEDARKQGLGNDEIHLLGYLDTPQWIDAYKIFELDEREKLLRLVQKVDDVYGTRFYNEMVDS
jgi:hypothetical protein